MFAKIKPNDSGGVPVDENEEELLRVEVAAEDGLSVLFIELVEISLPLGNIGEFKSVLKGGKDEKFIMPLVFEVVNLENYKFYLLN